MDSIKDRRTIAVIAASLATCAALIVYGVTRDDPAPDKPPVPTAAVTYTVEGSGTAQISYLGHSQTGKATLVREARLPWKKTVRVPLGQKPIVSLVLDDNGTQASCTLAIRSRHVQRATATGPHGRANCTGTLPRPETAAGADTDADAVTGY